MSKNATGGRTANRVKPVRTAQVRSVAARRTAGKRPPVGQQASRWPLIVGMAIAAVVAGVVVFAVRNQSDPAGTAGGGFGHVHGIAVDPASKALLVATHVGLFRVDGEHTATRVSKEAPDLMGFTTAGPGRFLASGHPGEGDNGPANLGLIESTDGGATWQTMSLAGAADFHGLQAAHDTVYGYNSGDGAFMVSTDRRTWQRRSTVALGAFVISPTDPQVVLGVGESGVQHSADGGRTWHPMSGTPGFAAMSWPQPDQVWGVAPDGGVWRSADGGFGWQRRGQVPGEPHALTVRDGTIYAGLAGDRIVASTDGAATWTTRYSPN